MPYKPAVPCRKRPCPNTTTDRSGYCDDHRPAYLKAQDSKRLSSKARGYGWAWSHIRAHHLRMQPLCQDCLPKVVTATVVHHIDHDSYNNTEDNFLSLCNDCHEKRHKDTRFRG